MQTSGQSVPSVVSITVSYRLEAGRVQLTKASPKPGPASAVTELAASGATRSFERVKSHPITKGWKRKNQQTVVKLIYTTAISTLHYCFVRFKWVVKSIIS